MTPPLHHTPPDGGEAFYLRTADGVQLRAAMWTGQGARRGVVVLCHGRSEFIEKYYEVIERLLSLGFDVLTFDWRGQGLSDRLLTQRLHGHVDTFASYERDLDAAFAALDDRRPGAPVLLIGHSMGGCALVRHASLRKRKHAGMILTAPMLGLLLPSVAAPALRAISWSLAHWEIGKRRVNPGDVRTAADWPYEGNVLTSNRAEFDRYVDLVRLYPDLALGGVTWTWLDAALRETRALADLPRNSIDIPALVFMAGEEELVSNDAIEAFAENNDAVRLVPLEGSRHEPFIEVDAVRQILWREIEAFADKHIPAPPADTPAT